MEEMKTDPVAVLGIVLVAVGLLIYGWFASKLDSVLPQLRVGSYSTIF